MVIAIKVFKKTSPNGKLTVYVGQRDFVDYVGRTDPIDGVIVADEDYLQNRKVYGMVTVTFRFGREEDETMGLKFDRDMVLFDDQLHPQGKSPKLTELQEKLLKKLGSNAFPFTFNLPQMSPLSVTILPADETQVQYAKPDHETRRPSTMVSKGFAMSSGKLSLEVNLEKDIYYHGQQIDIKVNINNSSKKQVKNIKAQIVQHCEVTMVNKHFSRVVAERETREGCPITPGATLNKTFYLTADVKNAKDKGIALDGQFRDADVNLASTTLVPSDQSSGDALGVVIAYSARVRLNCGTLGGELLADLPFKLLHPLPGSDQQQEVTAAQKTRAIEGSEASPHGGQLKRSGPSQDLIFEDFSKLRRGKSVDDL